MKILMVLTSHDRLGDYRPQDRLLARGARRALLRVQGCRCGGGPRLAEGRASAARSEEQRAGFSDRPDPALRGGRRGQRRPVEHGPARRGVTHAGFDAVFYPGGHGPLWDLAEDPASIRLIETTLRPASRSPSSATPPACAASHAKSPDGQPLAPARRVTRLHQHEEEAVGP